MVKKNIGILAFQGGVVEHAQIIKKLGQNAIEVRNVKDLNNCDSVIIPGGESTTIGFFLNKTGLMQAIHERAQDLKNPMPIWGTCAGAILLAKNIVGKIVPPSLKLIDMEIERNAYGTQTESFYTEIEIPKISTKKMKAAFVRAPIINKVGANVKILAKHENQIVLIQQGTLLASTFHPELRNDPTLHEYFILL